MFSHGIHKPDATHGESHPSDRDERVPGDAGSRSLKIHPCILTFIVRARQDSDTYLLDGLAL